MTDYNVYVPFQNAQVTGLACYCGMCNDRVTSCTTSTGACTPCGITDSPVRATQWMPWPLLSSRSRWCGKHASDVHNKLERRERRSDIRRQWSVRSRPSTRL